MTRTLDIETITPESFAAFGTVVDWTPALEETGRGFHILVRSEEPTGWRLAILKVTPRQTDRLENHPGTEELFAPVQGQSILLVAERGPFDPAGVHAFLLNRPVSVAPGVWHGCLALSDYATILIAENLEVTSEYARLAEAVKSSLS